MECVLQWVDEIDDAVAALRQWWLRAAPEIGLLVAAGSGIGALLLAVQAGAFDAAAF
jgi:hypothetical protein